MIEGDSSADIQPLGHHVIEGNKRGEFVASDGMLDADSILLDNPISPTQVMNVEAITAYAIIRLSATDT